MKTTPDAQDASAGTTEPSISVVIPVFRSANMLEHLLERVEAALLPVDPAFEMIFVEDDGGDDAWQVIERLAKAHSRVVGLRLLRNYGQHNALLCGIRAARGAIIVTLDDDLQNPPEEIPRLVAKLGDGLDVVYGTPSRLAHGILRNVASKMTKLALQQAMGADTAANVSAFRAIRSPVREGFADFRSPAANIDVLLTWGTTRFGSLEVRHDARADGRSGYTFGKLVTHALNMMTGFSTLPLQLASMMGLVFGAIGFAMLAYVVVRYLIEGTTVPGFPFLASIITIFSGVQLFALGVFGEYLARVHYRSMDRPPYAIRDTTKRDDHGPS